MFVPYVPFSSQESRAILILSQNNFSSVSITLVSFITFFKLYNMIQTEWSIVTTLRTVQIDESSVLASVILDLNK